MLRELVHGLLCETAQKHKVTCTDEFSSAHLRLLAGAIGFDEYIRAVKVGDRFRRVGPDSGIFRTGDIGVILFPAAVGGWLMRNEKTYAQDVRYPDDGSAAFERIR